jgi:hypothetical protein
VNWDGTGSWPIAIGRFSDPAYSPDGSSIAVQSDGAVWTFTAAGKPEKQLSAPGVIAGNPAWSPDGSLVAFDEQLRNTSEIEVVNADGTDEHTLISGPCVREPDWSPDGTKIAFTACWGGGTAIWVMNADGSNPVELTTGPSDEDPAWSPDGNWIAFSGWRADQGLQIHLVRPSGDDDHPLTNALAASSPTWSPDGSELAFIRDGDAFLSDLQGNVRGPIADGVGGELTWQRAPASTQPGCTMQGAELGDVLIAETGTNVLCGGPGADLLRGGVGTDVLVGGDGNDHLVGGAGHDAFLGGAGNDLIDARDGAGGDVVDGGPGFDTALVDAGDIARNVERVERVEPRNLARNRPVTASFSFAYGPPVLADDAQHLLWWASYYAPQWIEIDLGRPYAVHEIQLNVSQNPTGHTLNVVFGGPSPDPQRVLHTFSGITHDGEVLDFATRSPWRNVRYVRVATYDSPSWVAWREIRILR